MLSHWESYALAIAGVLGFVLQQVSLGTGRLAPSVATISVANAVVGIAIGTLLLDSGSPSGVARRGGESSGSASLSSGRSRSRWRADCETRHFPPTARSRRRDRPDHPARRRQPGNRRGRPRAPNTPRSGHCRARVRAALRRLVAARAWRTGWRRHVGRDRGVVSGIAAVTSPSSGSTSPRSRGSRSSGSSRCYAIASASVRIGSSGQCFFGSGLLFVAMMFVAAAGTGTPARRQVPGRTGRGADGSS